MLITELKNKDTVISQLKGKVFVLICHGCREIHFPEHEADAFVAELTASGFVTGTLTTDYICNPENLALRLGKHAAAIDAAETILVLSCGVGVQTVADKYPGKRVIAGCDTVALPGFQGSFRALVNSKQNDAVSRFTALNKQARNKLKGIIRKLDNLAIQ